MNRLPRPPAGSASEVGEREHELREEERETRERERERDGPLPPMREATRGSQLVLPGVGTYIEHYHYYNFNGNCTIHQASGDGQPSTIHMAPAPFRPPPHPAAAAPQAPVSVAPVAPVAPPMARPLTARDLTSLYSPSPLSAAAQLASAPGPGATTTTTTPTPTHTRRHHLPSLTPLSQHSSAVPLPPPPVPAPPPLLPRLPPLHNPHQSPPRPTKRSRFSSPPPQPDSDSLSDDRPPDRPPALPPMASSSARPLHAPYYHPHHHQQHQNLPPDPLIPTTNSSSPSHPYDQAPASASAPALNPSPPPLRTNPLRPLDEAQSNDWEAVVEMYTTGKGTDDGVALKNITKGDGRRVSDRKLLEKRRTIGKTFECLGPHRFEAAIGYKWENGVRRKQKMYHVISRCRVVNAMRKAGEPIPNNSAKLTALIDDRIAEKEALKEAARATASARRPTLPHPPSASNFPLDLLPDPHSHQPASPLNNNNSSSAPTAPSAATPTTTTAATSLPASNPNILRPLRPPPPHPIIHHPLDTTPRRIKTSPSPTRPTTESAVPRSHHHDDDDIRPARRDDASTFT